jgi:hypothetical protein
MKQAQGTHIHQGLSNDTKREARFYIPNLFEQEAQGLGFRV